MPFSLFDHQTLRHYRDEVGASDEFGHTFGGDPADFGIRFVNVERPLHLIYRLNMADSAVAVAEEFPALKWLPLCYGFAYATFDGEMIYRVVNETEIELIAPTDAHYDPDFPYPNYPRSFPQSRLTFVRQPYDPTVAEDALSLAAIFEVDRISEPEMQRAVAIVEKEGLLAEWRSGDSFADWSPEDFIRRMHKEPFMQGAPLKSCTNPDCTAEIAYRREPMEITLPEEFAELLDGRTLSLEAEDVRRDSMRVFAIHQPDRDDTLMWGHPFVQLIFEICEVCHCIRVSNQCT